MFELLRQEHNNEKMIKRSPLKKKEEKEKINLSPALFLD